MSLPIRRALEESRWIVLILLVWSIPSILATGHGQVQFAVLLGAFVMGGLFSIVRGVALADDANPAYETPDAGSVVRENGLAILAGAPWLVLGLVMAVVGPTLWHLVPFLDGVLLRAVSGRLVQVFAFTGLFTILLVAVASGSRAIRSTR